MRYFTIKELCQSNTAAKYKIDNSPTSSVEANLVQLVDNILDPLRARYGKPIHVSSGYRSKRLNAAVGGVSNSQHLYGQAADILGHDRSIGETKKLFQLIQDMRLPFDQLILEHSRYGSYWVHVSYSPKNRRQVIGDMLKK